MKNNQNNYKEPKNISDYPRNLRGPSQNKWGGFQNKKIKGYNDSRGPAGPCRVFSEEEIKEYERQMRKRGRHLLGCGPA